MSLAPKPLKRKIRALFLDRSQDFHGIRRTLAHRYLEGNGLEIGALHYPQEVPDGVRVAYVDRMDAAELRRQYPELASEELVEPDIIDDGEKLAKVEDSSQDFIIANHFIEHCMDPIGAIENHLRALKPGGILFMGVPDKRDTFDKDRPVTTPEHLARDYSEGGAVSRHEHFQEWVAMMDKLSGKAAADRVKELEDMDYSIHFHVWTPWEFVELLTYCKKKLRFPIELEAVEKNHHEFIVVLRKAAARS